MSEAMARALAAPGPYTVIIGDKECTVRPLGIQELSEVERECLKQFKRDLLETYSSNVDLLGDKGITLLEKKFEEIASWDVENLPPKNAFDHRRIEVNDTLRAWMFENQDMTKDTEDKKAKRLIAASLDQGLLTEADYKRMVGKNAPKMKIPYVNWWVTGCFSGMIQFVWTCFRHNGVTREQVVEAMRNRMDMLVELSTEIERLSSPSVGNGLVSPS